MIRISTEYLIHSLSSVWKIHLYETQLEVDFQVFECKEYIANGSKTDAISDNISCLVTVSCAKLGTGGTLSFNLSELASQNSPQDFFDSRILGFKIIW